MEERTILDADGVVVFTRWWAIDHPRAVVLVSHGAAEHSGRYDRFAHALNDAGIAAVALDHRGPDEPARRPAPVSWARAEAEPSSTTCTSCEPLHLSSVGDVPVMLFGHSMGSPIAPAYLARHAGGLAGGVLCGVPINAWLHPSQRLEPDRSPSG